MFHNLKLFLFGLTITAIGLLGSAPPSVTAAPPCVQATFVPWIGSTPYQVAADLGYFQAEGVCVNLAWEPDFAKIVGSFSDGSVDIMNGTLADYAALPQLAGKMKAYEITDFSVGGDVFIADAGILDICGLKGKAVAAARGSVSHFLLVNFLLQGCRLTTADVTERLVDSFTDAVQLFVTDPAVAGVVTFDPFARDALKGRAGAHILTDTSKLDAPIVYDTHIVRSVIDAATVRAINRAFFRVLQAIVDRPDEAAAIMAKPLGLSVDETKAAMAGVQYHGLAANRQLFGLDTPGVTSLAEQNFALASDIWVAEGIIKSEERIDPKTFFDRAFLDEVNK